MVTATKFAKTWRTTKFSGDDNHRTIQHPPVLQVTQQRGDRFVAEDDISRFCLRFSYRFVCLLFRATSVDLQLQVRHPTVVFGDRLEPSHSLVLQDFIPANLQSTVQGRLTTRVRSTCTQILLPLLFKCVFIYHMSIYVVTEQCICPMWRYSSTT